MFEQDENARLFGITPLENLFIRDYLPAAKGDYLKVYIWGLYQSQKPEEDYGVLEMAKELDMQVTEVESALRYWERRALVTLVSNDPPVYRFFSPLQRMQAGELSDRADDAYTDFAECVYAAFGDKRKVRPTEIAQAWEWVQDIGLPTEVVLMLIHHCMVTMRPQFSFKKAEALAVSMKESHVVTVEDADAFLRNDLNIHKGTQEVLRQLGKRSRLPSEPELAMYKKWQTQWHFDHAAILAACNETTKGEPTFAYLDGILNGIHTRSAARTKSEITRQLKEEKNEGDLAREVLEKLGMQSLARQTAINFYRQWVKKLPHEVLLLAAQECARAGGKVEAMERMVDSWQEKNLTDKKKALSYLSRFNEINQHLLTLFESCGYTGKPTAADRALFEKWQGMGMNMDLLIFAAEQSRAASGNKINYLDKVITTWHEAGITDISQAKGQKRPENTVHKIYDKKPRLKTVTAQQYTQRTYTEDQLAGASAGLIEEALKENG